MIGFTARPDIERVPERRVRTVEATAKPKPDPFKPDTLKPLPGGVPYPIPGGPRGPHSI